jgi:putative FmdB family regulatory protein
VPVYEFRCRDCGTAEELLLPLGATDPRPCRCGGTQRYRLGRVAVRYGGWGFTATDRLVADTRGKDYKQLSERAERIADE